jgi:hypothetical protein
MWSERAEPSAGAGSGRSTNRSAEPSPSASAVFEPSATKESVNAEGPPIRFAPSWEQRLAWGYLPARTYRQFVVIEPRTTPARIMVTESAGTIRVRNELGIALERLLLRARNGKLYATEQFAAGAELIAHAVDPELAEKTWSTVIAAHAPTLPAGFTAGDLEPSPGVFASNYYYGGSSDDQFGQPNLTTALAETRFSALLTNRFARLQAGMFVAQTQDGPILSRGVTKWRSGHDFHVVFGNW